MQNPRPHMRAEGNLTYLQFIALVEYLWLQGHPDIPFEPAGNELPARYPSMVYSMQLSKVHPQDPKPRFREYLDDDTDTLMQMWGQRFQIVVTFSAVTEKDPHLADVLVEEFENFMMEYTRVFKKLGLSEITYGRRMPDREETRPGEGVIWRTTSYFITVEKIVAVPVDKLRRLHVDARRMLNQTSTFFVVNSDSSIDVMGDTFKIGDQVHIGYRAGQPYPEGLPPGPYNICNIAVVNESRKYYLTRASGEAVENVAPATGYIYRIDDDVTIEVHDQYADDDLDQGF